MKNAEGVTEGVKRHKRFRKLKNDWDMPKSQSSFVLIVFFSYIFIVPRVISLPFSRLNIRMSAPVKESRTFCPIL